MIIKDKKAPGQKLIDNLSLKSKWLLCSVGGLLMVSLGLILFSEAAFLRMKSMHTATWIFLGVLGLAVVNAGIVFFGKGIAYKAEIKSKKLFKERQKQFRKQNAMKKKAARSEKPADRKPADNKTQKNS